MSRENKKAMIAQGLTRLRHALLVDAKAAPFVEDVMEATAAPSTTRPSLQLALAWFPQDIHVAVDLYVDGRPLPGGFQFATGGLLFFGVPDDAWHEGSRLDANLDFMGGGWKFQLWRMLDGQKSQLIEAKDSDPTNPSDDVNTYSETL